ncbi:MAG: hypothetical protein M3M99_00655 [Actinomycetota bacterium]|nr:hypothetical protein [Actinomycetota bacterium]
MRPAGRQGLAAAASVLTLVGLLAGCGSGDDGGDDSATRPAPAASEFPAAGGQSLEQVLSAASSEGPVVSPAARVVRQGDDRFPFGVFTADKKPITDAQVAIYAAPGKDLSGPAIGPFPARIEDLSTESAFRAQSTADDPDAAPVVYVSELRLDKPGPWAFGALIKEGDSYSASLLPTPSLVGEFNPPNVGDKAPSISTPTAADVADLSEIDTRVPPGTMHEVDFEDVLGREPIVLLFATPALCQSRICGPVVDVAEQVNRDYGDQVAFIHQEVYNDNEIQKGTRPQLQAYDLPSEPWLFVIDANGIIRTAIEGAFSVDELTAAVEQVGGKA